MKRPSVWHHSTPEKFGHPTIQTTTFYKILKGKCKRRINNKDNIIIYLHFIPLSVTLKTHKCYSEGP